MLVQFIVSFLQSTHEILIWVLFQSFFFICGCCCEEHLQNISCPFGLARFWAGSGWEVRFRTHWNFYLIFLMIRSPLFKVSWRAQNLEMCVMTLTPHLPVKIWQKEHFWNTVHCSLSNSYHQNTHKNHVQFIAVSTVQIRSIHCCIAFSSLFIGGDVTPKTSSPHIKII